MAGIFRKQRGPRKTESQEEKLSICGRLPGLPPPPWGDRWLLKQAVCERQNPNRTTFWVDCVGQINPSWHAKLLSGTCGKGLICNEFHGLNELFDRCFDIICANEQTVRDWFLEAAASHNYVSCSPHYVNNAKGNMPVNMSLLVNVLDSDRLNRIDPHGIYFLLNESVKIGVQRGNDADVESGIVTVPPGSSVQACVEIVPGQAVWAVVTLIGVIIVNCALGNC